MSKVQKWGNTTRIRDVIANQLRIQGAQWPRTSATLIMSDLAKAGFIIKKDQEEE